jgi:SAM-dependent methyltransferase
MNTDRNITTGTSDDVLQYYSKNWEKIANCYSIDEKGLPIDPAWYRRRLYQEFLKTEMPASVLDVGCGGGWTVLDALELGIDARGIEPVKELKEHGCSLLEKNGYDPLRITQEDLAILATLPSESQDCIALLSVIPHVPAESWEQVHKDIFRVLRPGGKIIAAYRNELFDLFTFNSVTLEFYDKSLWATEVCSGLRTNETLDNLKGLMTNPDLPGKYFTAAQDKSFGQLERMKSNPLTISEFLSQFGLDWKRSQFYHFHSVPPLMANKISNFREINHKAELIMSDDWRGNFMCPMFLVTAEKPNKK